MMLTMLFAVSFLAISAFQQPVEEKKMSSTMPKYQYGDTKAPIAESKYTVTLSLADWQAKINILEYAKTAIRNSNIPTNVGIPLMDSLTVVQNDLSVQIREQLTSEAQKDKPASKKK
jgi:hypothetical protein